MLLAYCGATSCAPGEILGFHLSGAVDGSVAVEDATSDRIMLQSNVSAPTWELTVPGDWPSSLYRARFSPGDTEVYFAVRALKPASPILVSIPFATWLAYDRSGVPGEGLYYAEQPQRAARVSFDRPWCGPPPERWEDGLLRWLGPAGYKVDYCSNLDLHQPLDPAYRVLVINGHDEYWSWEMRDTVESFARNGGNIAILGGNTCYWQARFEDNLRTMVCYRDAVADPIADRSRVTVEWSNGVVNRPENAMTGVSYRRGAGAWGPYMGVMKEHAYTARFADHWVFDGTGVTDGSSFGLGAIGYETDAAAYEEVDGVPRITGKDGTPPSFVILATADLRHWRRYGQGGFATMGVFQLGQGAVFNAATVNWGNTLADPVVERITRNVLDRLSVPSPGGWEIIGPQHDVVALTACEHELFAVSVSGQLLRREACGQNLPWRAMGSADGAIGLATPTEAVAGMPVALYAVTSVGALQLWSMEDSSWTGLGGVPMGTVDIAISDGTLFALTADSLWHVPLAYIATRVGAAAAASGGWQRVESTAGLTSLTATNGRLFALDNSGKIHTRLPWLKPAPWTHLTDATGMTVLTAHQGRLIGTAPGRHLYWRTISPGMTATG